jgi:hypothetical protein
MCIGVLDHCFTEPEILGAIGSGILILLFVVFALVAIFRSHLSVSTDESSEKNDQQEENPNREFNEIPPFRVGEITDLIKGLVNFKVREIKVTSNDEWEFHGTALVCLPTGSTTPEPIRVISGKDGNITSFSVPYLTASGKPGVVTFGKGWNGTFENADEEDEKYYIIIDDVEKE